MLNIKHRRKPCQCGCGRKTSIAKQTRSGKGHIKGEPINYIHGHNIRGEGNPNWIGGVIINSRGTVFIRLNGKYVREHLIVVEKALGKEFPEGAIIHHVDRDKRNNANDNLVVCEDQGYHMLLHQRMRALEACGHTDWKKCLYCNEYDEPDKILYRHRYHKECLKELNRRNWKRMSDLKIKRRKK